jgi:hypothetical protein
MRTTSKIAAVAAGLVIAGGAAAAAVDAPEAANHGLTTAEEHTGIELPASEDSHPTKDDHPGGGAADDAEDAVTDVVEAEAGGPVDNHGAEVSAVAKDDSTTGREHGQAVAEVASDGRAGGGGDDAAAGAAPVTTPNEGGIGTGSEASGEANEVGADHAADQATAGSENAGDHGKP